MIALARDLSSFGYFSRNKAGQYLKFACRTTCHRTPSGERLSVRCGYEDYVAHVLVKPSRLAAVCITDKEYPSGVAFQLLYIVAREVDKKLGQKWRLATQELKEEPAFLTKLLKEYGNPKQVDKVGEIKDQISKIKLTLKENLQDIMVRGETLEDVLHDAEDLDAMAKQFAVTAKKHNQCCKSW